jgi:homoaconitase/3-isopropylmalate dehydratase large subunit
VHLASPAVVAASAILGRIAAPGDVPAPREAVPV